MEIADQLKDLIYSGIYQPNDKLPSERDLAIQFKAGRLAVREALRVLEHSGFITIKQGSRGGAFIELTGTNVVKRSLTDFIRLSNVTPQNLTEARISIELSVAEFAMQRITDEEMASLYQNIMGTKRLGEEGSDTVGSNVNFHMLLAKAAKNPILETLLAGILDIYLSSQGQWNIDPDFKRNHVEEHLRIYEALKTGEMTTFINAIKQHVLSISEQFTKVQKETSMPVKVSG